MTKPQELHMPTPCAPPHPRPSATQHGLSLIVVLLALVTLAFASVALIRSIDTGALVMGNLGFKKAATASSDQPVNTAITWLQGNLTGAKLFADDTANAYISTSLTSLDAGGNSGNVTRPRIDWNGDSCGSCVGSTCSACFTPSTAVSTADGFSHRYLITRMCSCAGDPNGNCTGTTTSNSCSYPASTTAGASPKKGELKYGDNTRFSGSGSPYYRIIVRTEGPRNTATVTETYVHF